MVEFTKMKDIDIEAMLYFLKQRKLYEEGIEKVFSSIFLIKEAENIYGFAIIELYDEKCIISTIYVDPLKRKLDYGDGLLRSMLNYAYVKGVREAYYLGVNTTIYSFLMKKGFKIIEADQYYNKVEINKVSNHNILFMQLNNFFTKPCEGILKI